MFVPVKVKDLGRITEVLGQVLKVYLDDKPCHFFNIELNKSVFDIEANYIVVFENIRCLDSFEKEWLDTCRYSVTTRGVLYRLVQAGVLCQQVWNNLASYPFRGFSGV